MHCNKYTKIENECGFWITSLRSVNQSSGLPHCVRFSKDVLFEVQGKVKRLQRFSFFMA